MTKIIFSDKKVGQFALMNATRKVSEKEAENDLSPALNCYHCGDECPDVAIAMDDKAFCCQGCKMVYSILNDNDLDTFYTLNSGAGTSRKRAVKLEYSYLDDPGTISKLIDFTDGKIIKVHFSLPQIHCSSCLWLLEHLYRLNEGVIRSRVDFLKKSANITFDTKITSLRQVVELLAKIGYPPTIQFNDLEEEKSVPVDKTLYYKLGLAGFAFGNIMLLSFPEYLGMNPSSHQRFVQYFGYLNIALILPVLFYSGRDYFRSAWQGLKQKHLNIDVPVSLGISALFLRSVYEILSHTGAGYLDSLAGLIFFLLIGKWFQQGTYSRISFDRDYKSYFPIAARLKTQKQENPIALDKIKEGDILIVRHGELIPTDSILNSEAAHIDYSFVSGESALIKKEAGELLYAGGRQMGSSIEILVLKKVSNSYLTQLWNDHTFEKNKIKSPASQLADQVASFFTWFILLIAFGTLIYWLPRDTSIAINAFTAVLIIACPCAVALSIPFTFGNVTRIFARQGIYFKNTQVIEALAKINLIVFDKTGTLTDRQNSNLTFHGKALQAVEKNWISHLAKNSMHPISQLINQQYAVEGQLEIASFVETKGLGIEGKVASHLINIGSMEFLQNRQIAIPAGSPTGTYLSIDHKVRGFFTAENKYRNGLKLVLDQLKVWSKLMLLSGDNEKEKDQLAPFFLNQNDLFFNKKPAEKLSFIKTQQQEGYAVAMIGDGLNDAGALSQSEVGIVITEDTANFTPACDIIMHAEQFDKIPSLFSYAKGSIRLVYIAYGIALIYNIVGLSFAVQGSLSPVIAAILMPLSSISIVLFGVGASTLLAYKSGVIKTKK